ncbi:MAG: hypothetical protein ACRYE8_00945 [Janthinobacterium lividum]
MSNHNKQTIYDRALNFAEYEINRLQDEITYLLENLGTKEDVERLEQRFKELEKIFF